jgi:hypothetical protein
MTPPSTTTEETRTGFLLGKSERKGFWRLYLSQDLTQYLEFRKIDTLYAEQNVDTTTTVWLTPDAVVEEVQTARSSADFLGGEIVSAELSNSHMSGFRRKIGLGVVGCTGVTSGDAAHCKAGESKGPNCKPVEPN